MLFFVLSKYKSGLFSGGAALVFLGDNFDLENTLEAHSEESSTALYAIEATFVVTLEHSQFKNTASQSLEQISWPRLLPKLWCLNFTQCLSHLIIMKSEGNHRREVVGKH